MENATTTQPVPQGSTITLENAITSMKPVKTLTTTQVPARHAKTITAISSMESASRKLSSALVEPTR